MSVPLPTWLSRAGAGVRALADRPWTLFCLLLALNAIARPATPLTHDARLYSLQALHAAFGDYGDDVFLRYGSQDQFSLFSRIVGPVVATIGLRWTFFAFYLVFNTLFIAAMFRFVRTLVADPLIATLSLVYLVTAPLPYGGYDIFMVHEQFFTPRLIGSTLTLFALERLLSHRFVTAFALLGAALLMHPLMAFGGVLIAATYVAAMLLPPRAVVMVIVGSILAFVTMMNMPWLDFGTIDGGWHQLIRLSVGYNYPDTWRLKDWVNLGVSFAVPIAAVYFSLPPCGGGPGWGVESAETSAPPPQPTPARGEGADRMRRFVIAVVIAGAVGFLTTLAASFLPYALLFQAQPYRVLWILKALQIPLGFLLIAHLNQSPSTIAKSVALALVGYFCVLHWNSQELIFVALAMPVSFLVAMGAAETANAGWWWYATARGFALGAIGWMAYRDWFFFNQREIIGQYFDVSEFALFDLVSPVFCLVGLGIGAALWCDAGAKRRPAFVWIAGATAFVIPLGLFLAEEFAAIRERHTRLGADMAFLHDIRHTPRRPGTARTPCVYSSLGRPDLLWIDVHATSYFDILQTAGVMFHRKTADEIERRITLVNKFEMARQQNEAIFLDDAKKLGMENLFKLQFDSAPPTREDLVRLCQEPDLDYVVVPHEFPGLYSATNGRIFVYECYKVRKDAGLAFSARSAAPATKSPAIRSER